MPLEKRLVDADVFLSDNMIAVNGGHAIDHQEGIAVRQHLHDLVHVQNRAVLHNGFAGLFLHRHGGLPFFFRRRRKSFGRLLGLTHLRKNPPGHFAVGRVAGLHGDDVRADGFSGQ